MARWSTSLTFALAALTTPLAARVATAQYTMERQPAVAPDSAAATVLRAVRADLTSLRLAQDSFYVAHGKYAAVTSALHGWKPASSALIVIQAADSNTWVAAAAHRQLVGLEVLTIRRSLQPASRP